MLKYLGLTALFLVSVLAVPSYCDTWGGAEIKAFRLINEKLMRFDVTTMQCSGAPCSQTIYYVVENYPLNWPSHNASELKQFQAVILTAMATGQKVNLDFSWNGYLVPGATNGSYFLNWLELVGQ